MLETVLRVLTFLIALVVPMISGGQTPPQLEGWTYDHTAITHSGDPSLDGLVAGALRLWGESSSITDGGSGRDIVIHYGPPPGSAAYAAAITLARGRPDEGRIYATASYNACDIYLDRAALAVNSPEHNQLVVMHEVGHCLGLGHSEDGNCVMKSGTAICAADRAWIAELYPLVRTGRVHALYLPGLASN